jgi:dTMP kinase
VIQPALERGAWVLCDRFADSTTAYQGFGRGFPVELMDNHHRFAIGAAVPDMTILLDVNVTLGMQRCSKTAGGQEDPARPHRERGAGIPRKGAPGLPRAGRAASRKRFRKVDAMRHAEPIAEDVWKLVSDAFLRQG